MPDTEEHTTVEGITGCPECGALVVDKELHVAWHTAVRAHDHSYAASYGPGGQWDRTGKMMP